MHIQSVDFLLHLTEIVSIYPKNLFYIQYANPKNVLLWRKAVKSNYNSANLLDLTLQMC